MEKIKCRVCKKNKADFMDYPICEQCEIKNMTKNKKIGKGINMDIVWDGRTSSGKWIKRISKVLWYYLFPIISAMAIGYMFISIFIGIGAW